MAGERTELAWWRTGLAALAVAVGIGRLAPELQKSGSTWPYVLVGVGFALYGIALFMQGTIRGRQEAGALGGEKHAMNWARGSSRGGWPGARARGRRSDSAGGGGLGSLTRVVMEPSLSAAGSPSPARLPSKAGLSGVGLVPAPVPVGQRRRGDPVEEDREANREVDRQQDRLPVGSCDSTTITAKTIEARPRGPNQPMNVRVAGRARVPSIAIATGSIRTTVRLRAAEGEVPAHLPERRAQQDGAEEQEGDPVSTLPTSSTRRFTSAGSRPSIPPKTPPATKAAMKPDPSSPAAIPYASAAPAAGITCSHAPVISLRGSAKRMIAAIRTPPATPPRIP